MTHRPLLAVPLLATSFLALGLLAACGSTPTQVFILNAADDRAPRPVPAGRAPSVFVDRTSVAAYFDRTQMVTRTGAFRLSIHEFEVWGEPIADLISNAMVDDLARRFGDDHVQRTPRGRTVADARVQLDVLRFDVDEAGAVTLDVRWTVLPANGTPIERRERFLATAADPKDAASRVVALRETLTALAATVGDAVAAGTTRR